jgi:hypothetical protein
MKWNQKKAMGSAGAFFASSFINSTPPQTLAYMVEAGETTSEPKQIHPRPAVNQGRGSCHLNFEKNCKDENGIQSPAGESVLHFSPVGSDVAVGAGKVRDATSSTHQPSSSEKSQGTGISGS